MSKSVSINPNPRNKPKPDAAALDAFVQGSEAQLSRTPDPAMPVPKGPMKRLTFDIAADLHKRIRMTCLDRGKDMAEELRRILNENFPA
jgi:hypothetical protein